MKLVIYLMGEAVETDIDPSQQEAIQEELRAACMGTGKVVTIGTVSVVFSHVSGWKFIPE